MLGGLTVGSSAAWAHGASDGGSHHKGDGDFTLFGRFTDFEKEDNGKEGWSEKDVVTFAYDLFDRGGRAGDGDGSCTITELDKDDHEFAADCEQVFDLEDGNLDLEGTITDEDFKAGEIVLDIVDGSGDYKDADGTVTFTKAEGHGGGHHKNRTMSGSHGDDKDGHHKKDGHHGFLAEVDLHD
jgi:hypothetical protein